MADTGQAGQLRQGKRGEGKRCVSARRKHGQGNRVLPASGSYRLHQQESLTLFAAGSQRGMEKRTRFNSTANREQAENHGLPGSFSKPLRIQAKNARSEERRAR